MSVEDFWREFWVSYKKGTWEPETKKVLEHHLGHGSLFVDIGAWIGPVTLWALKLGADVIAIEPDPVALRELQRQLENRGNDIVSRVEIWAGACAPHNGFVTIHPYTWGDSMTQVGTSSEVTVSDDPALAESWEKISVSGQLVHCWTLEHILRGRTPTLVKMDVEGYETTLLPSVGPFLSAKQIPLLVSLHSIMPIRPEWFQGYTDVTGVARTTIWSAVEAR